MGIKTVAVIGAGAMGNGIAQVTAVAGYKVMLNDLTDTALNNAMGTINRSLNKMVEKGKLTAEDAKASTERITLSTSLEECCKDADLIIESVFEDLELKKTMFREIDQLAKPEAIIGTNTSAIPVTEIATGISRGDKIIGIHFMNPVPLMKGVEVIKGQLTSEETFQTTLEYLHSMGKDPAVAVDYAGFIVSRLLNVMINEAFRLVQEGNDPEEIDKAMVLCAGHPMGPCRLNDLVGAEITLRAARVMEKDFGDRYKPHPMLNKRVLAGLLGQKSGQGFYSYKK
jgi:3-hydroxybutyryl-CoA dehydrogenase